MQSLVKIKSLRNGEITLSFTDIGKSCPSSEFLPSQVCLLALFRKKYSHENFWIYSKHNILNAFIFQSCLSVSKATDPGSTSCEKAKFLINSDLLYEVVVFGLADKDSKVDNKVSFS